ncbi:glycosyltransferase [Acinetobacter sp. A3]|uniref:glycosyltransferase n=1 Tax=Acinetobacter sp. A3 TaxID=2725492 RepID=UPI00144539D5|nr:glycosyltransferase [Acinetobacter sp. A3]
MKQPHRTIRAFTNFKTAKNMLIIGDGDLKIDLQTLCKHLEIEDRIEFLGWGNHPYPYIQPSRLLITSSQNEGYGLIISETLHWDVPVVAITSVMRFISNSQLLT